MWKSSARVLNLKTLGANSAAKPKLDAQAPTGRGPGPQVAGRRQKSCHGAAEVVRGLPDINTNTPCLLLLGCLTHPGVYEGEGVKSCLLAACHPS